MKKDVAEEEETVGQKISDNLNLSIQETMANGKVASQKTATAPATKRTYASQNQELFTTDVT